MMTDSGAEALTHAIVRQACVDWKKATKQLEKDLGDKDASCRQCECERFFRSDYFQDLTGMDGKDFLDILRRNYNERQSFKPYATFARGLCAGSKRML